VLHPLAKLEGMKPDYEALAKLGAKQDQVATRAQLKKIGFSDWHVGELVRKKLWTNLQRGVQLLGAAPASWRQRARAAQLAGGDGVALDAGSALLWLGFEGPEEGDIELTRVSCKGGPCPAGAIVRRPSRAVTTVMREGVRVVAIEDALLSFAALSGDRRRVEVAIESVLLARKSTERKIWRHIGLNSRRGVRGVALLRSVMENRPCAGTAPRRSRLRIYAGSERWRQSASSSYV